MSARSTKRRSIMGRRNQQVQLDRAFSLDAFEGLQSRKKNTNMSVDGSKTVLSEEGLRVGSGSDPFEDLFEGMEAK